MRYELELILQLCGEVGLPARLTDDRVEVELCPNAVLHFQNAEDERDSLIGFSDTPWHTHGDLKFSDAHGRYVEIDYLDVIVALRDGRVLICERQTANRTVDRWLIHRDYSDELRWLEQGEQLVIRRAIAPPLEEAAR